MPTAAIGEAETARRQPPSCATASTARRTNATALDDELQRLDEELTAARRELRDAERAAADAARKATRAVIRAERADAWRRHRRARRDTPSLLSAAPTTPLCERCPRTRADVGGR